MANSLAHTKWMCKYQIVFTPKYRRKIIYNQYKESIVQILRDLCKWKGVEIIEGKAMVDHVHMLVSIPPSAQAHRAFIFCGLKGVRYNQSHWGAFSLIFGNL